MRSLIEERVIDCLIETALSLRFYAAFAIRARRPRRASPAVHQQLQESAGCST